MANTTEAGKPLYCNFVLTFYDRGQFEQVRRTCAGLTPPVDVIYLPESQQDPTNPSSVEARVYGMRVGIGQFWQIIEGLNCITQM